MSTIVLHRAVLIDGTGRDPQPNSSVVVEDGAIAAVGPAGSTTVPHDAEIIDLDGMTLLPGLTDAHVHFGLLGLNHRPTLGPDDNLTTYVLDVVDNMETALQEGFTTVRDAAGLDPAFAFAVERGLIEGPRVLPAGSPLSQTGGHGDPRGRYESAVPQSIPGLLAAPEICDGADAVRAAARRQLRLGATQIKVMGSGGVMSPTDKLESVQFTVEEIAAAVHEAESAGTYVMAHCHTPPAIASSLSAGVRSIEHGSILDEPTAAQMAERGAYMVPTLVVMEVLARESEAQGVSPDNMAKLEMVMDRAPVSVGLAAESGVRVGSGSDLLGKRQTKRAEELSIKSKLLGPMEAILSATSTNAKLFRMEDRIGAVREGMAADMVAVDGDPLSDLGLFSDPERVRVVVKGGRVVRDTR